MNSGKRVRDFAWLAFVVLLSALFGCKTSDYAEARAAQAERDKWNNTLTEAARTNQPMLITPLVGIGPVKFGMTFDEVKQVTGEPDFMTGGRCPQYRQGFSLVPRRGEEKVAVIMAGGSCKGDDLLVAAFKGATKEGIGMNSTRKEIISAFGQPASVRDGRQDGDPEVEYLEYDKLGMNLILRKGKLVHFALRPARTTSENAAAGK